MVDDAVWHVKTTPGNARDRLTRETRCLYTVSVPQHHAMAELVEGWRWTRQHFAECAVLVGDGLYRHTLCAQRGLDPQAAVQAASKGLPPRARRPVVNPARTSPDPAVASQGAARS